MALYNAGKRIYLHDLSWEQYNIAFSTAVGTSLKIVAIGLERISHVIIKDLVQILPANLAKLGIEDLDDESLVLIYEVLVKRRDEVSHRIIRHVKKNQEFIEVICGDKISAAWKEKFANYNLSLDNLRRKRTRSAKEVAKEIKWDKQVAQAAALVNQSDHRPTVITPSLSTTARVLACTRSQAIAEVAPKIKPAALQISCQSLYSIMQSPTYPITSEKMQADVKAETHKSLSAIKNDLVSELIKVRYDITALENDIARVDLPLKEKQKLTEVISNLQYPEQAPSSLAEEAWWILIDLVNAKKLRDALSTKYFQLESIALNNLLPVSQPVTCGGVDYPSQLSPFSLYQSNSQMTGDAVSPSTVSTSPASLRCEEDDEVVIISHRRCV